MRAWYYTKFGGPAVVQLGDLPEPELREPTDLIIKVHAAALNPIDYKRRQGVLKSMLKKVEWPTIVGYDVSGVVHTCGVNVTRFKVGDPVFCMLPHDRIGALAEYAVVGEEYVAHKPSNLSHIEAASIPLVSLTALQCFRSGSLQPNKKVLITGGGGGVGTMAIQMAKNVFNADKVIATASTRKVGRVKEVGADEVVDYKEQKFEYEVDGVDFALDCTGEAMKCMECVLHGGTVVSIAETPYRDVFRGLESKGIQVSTWLGFILDCLTHSIFAKARSNGIVYKYQFSMGNGAELEEIRGFCEARKIAPVVSKMYTFDKADVALEYLETGRSFGKVVVQIIE